VPVTPLPPLVHFSTEGEYRVHYELKFCRDSLLTFDDIPVRFRIRHFDHCMFESNRRNGVKDRFSQRRAQRMDWIRATLINLNSNPRQGWDAKNNCIDPNRRVAVLFERFVVVIRCWWKDTEKLEAEFVTCFIADDEEIIRLIRAKPKWRKEDCR